MKKITIDGQEYNLVLVEEKKEKDYEIITTCPIEGTIFRVKYFPTGEITSIGDDVQYLNLKGKVTGFTVHSYSEQISVQIIDSKFKTNDIWLKDSKKVEKKEVLFTTGDGKEIHEEDGFWCMPADLEGGVLYTHAYKEFLPHISFSTLERAKEYLKENKKQYSIADIKKTIGKRDFIGTDYLLSQLERNKND